MLRCLLGKTQGRGIVNDVAGHARVGPVGQDFGQDLARDRALACARRRRHGQHRDLAGPLPFPRQGLADEGLHAPPDLLARFGRFIEPGHQCRRFGSHCAHASELPLGIPENEPFRGIDRGRDGSLPCPLQGIVEVTLASHRFGGPGNPQVDTAGRMGSRRFVEGFARRTVRGILVRAENDFPIQGKLQVPEAADIQRGPGFQARGLPDRKRGFRTFGDNQRTTVGPARELRNGSLGPAERKFPKIAGSRPSVLVDEDPLSAGHFPGGIDRPDDQ